MSSKLHYQSKVTGELCENIHEVIKAVSWVLVNRFPKPVPMRTYIQYIFLWEYSKQGF